MKAPRKLGDPTKRVVIPVIIEDSQILPLYYLGVLGLYLPVSINGAYSRLSERYEPWHRSHTGNVFTKVYYRVQGTAEARRIDDLSAALESHAAETLIENSPLSGPLGKNL